jgi:YVTN family beta-propeller protein
VLPEEEAFLKGLIISVLSFLFFLGCQAQSVYLKPALEEEGEVFLYARPFPQEADRLRFRLEGISALKDDGSTIPLSVPLSELKGSEMKRQRLIASGELPPGPYLGLSFRVKEAFLKGEEGEAALLVPDGPVRIDFPFQIRKKKASLLSLALNYGESIVSGFSFSPAFSISVPDRPISGLVGYVSNAGSNTVTVFDKKRMEVVGVIATGRGPKGVALDERSGRAYVAVSGEDAVEVIDVLSADIIARIKLNIGDDPHELALAEGGRLLLAANTGSDTVSFIDRNSLFERTRLEVGDGPHSILVDRTGRRAFVFNTLSNSISVIDIPNRSVVAEISTEPGPGRGEFNRGGDRLYVTHESTPYLTVLDPLSLASLQRIFVGSGMTSIKVDTNTDLLYIGKKHHGAVALFDPFASFLPVDSINIVDDATYMTIDGQENTLHLVIPEKKTVMIINLISRRAVSEIDVGEGPYWVTMMGER